ncbi:MAG TPA: T9SS type A sorting domain-containing protein, partial [Saprospiraceae bacterium]|nr:T9SS type A sorting domain-containing protein [Saprospiraceae bacterium]
LVISPNPVSETLYIDIPSKGICSISSIQGVQQWSRKLEAGHHQVPVTGWPKGMYVMTLDGGHTTKIIVE